MEDSHVPEDQLDWGYFAATFDKQVKVQFNELHLRQRELVTQLAGMPKMWSNDELSWMKHVQPWIIEELRPNHQQGIRAFVKQKSSDWFDQYNIQHIRTIGIWGPYDFICLVFLVKKDLYMNLPHIL